MKQGWEIRVKKDANKIKQLEEKTQEIKYAILGVFENSHSGHIASSYSCAELLVAIFYGDVMRFDPANPKWDGRDRFLLSKGHAGIIYYVVLSDLGFFPKSELDRFAQLGGKIGVHVHTSVPGVEANSGSLAGGFGVAVGMALAAKLDMKNHLVFALLGDGECYEGAIWESAMFAAGKHLNNLVVIVDHNHMCCSGFISDNLPIGQLEKKWDAFGFDGTSVKFVFREKGDKEYNCRHSKGTWAGIGGEYSAVPWFRACPARGDGADETGTGFRSGVMHSDCNERYVL